jgi:DNA-directed RNA polymerase specialized sigma subunit
MDILLKPSPKRRSIKKSSIKPSTSQDKILKQIKKQLGKRTITLLESKQIELWQASLRKQIHIEDLKFCFPHLYTGSPKGAPKWAGGEGLKHPQKESKVWEKDELEALLTRHKKVDTLFPWEISIACCQNSNRIIKLLTTNGVRPKEIKSAPTWIPTWSQYNNSGLKRVKTVKVLNEPQPFCLVHPLTHCITSCHQEEFNFSLAEKSESNLKEPKILKHKIKTGKWTEKEKENLAHYWKLELLGSDEIAALMERCPEKVITTAQELGLPKKHRISTEDWCGIKWQFTPEGDGDPRHLNPTLQRLVAEASATRFSLLYEVVHTINETDEKYRKIQRELNQILELHSRIFSKYLLTRSRKYKFLGTSAWQVQKDLEQAGQTAIFECLRRWHPNRNIRFSRGTVNIAINREMLAWLEQQRLVELPDKIRSVARKLKQAQDRGTWDKEVDRLKKEAGENCVREASKHQNTYAYLHTVPLMESYDETEAEHGGVTGGTAECIENFSAVCMPQSDTDVCSLLIEACSQIPTAEKRAVLAYHGINEDGTHGPQQTLEEIGAREGVTKERIRQRILKAKQRMRRWLERKNIKNVHDALSHV